jgi:hypothetical protein
MDRMDGSNGDDDDYDLVEMGPTLRRAAGRDGSGGQLLPCIKGQLGQGCCGDSGVSGGALLSEEA